MEKYFATLDTVYRLFRHKTTSEELKALMREDLDAQHDAGPEANYIIRVWAEERGTVL